MDENYYFERATNWLTDALFCDDRVRAAAAASNLSKALRQPEGQDAALIAIGESPCLTQRFLPRLWELRQRQVKSRAATRGQAQPAMGAA